jgi:hypothetical protein
MQDTCDALQYQQRPVGYKILQAHLFGGTWETRRLYAFLLVCWVHLTLFPFPVDAIVPLITGPCSFSNSRYRRT